MVENYRKGAHTVHDIKYHFVWITKYRYHVLKGDIAMRVRSIIREVCMSFDVKIPPGARRIDLTLTDAGSRSPFDLGNWVEAGFMCKGQHR